MSNSKFLVSFFLLFLFISLAAASSSYSNTSKCSAQQSLALLMFKQSLSSINFSIYDCEESLGSGYYPVMMNWKRNTDCCKWDGVKCNPFTGDVIALDLSCGMLHGNIHPNTTLFHLPHLQRLNLAYNYIMGSNFLHEIGRFASSLTHLNISDCLFTGEISWKIYLFPILVSLDLSWNGYGFRIQPYVLNNLLKNSTHLRDLLIANTNISWVLPRSLNISSSLKTLDLTATHLQGKLPNNIMNLPHLEKLVLRGNPNLTSSLLRTNKSTSIPLKWLDLSFTKLSGEVPDSIGQWKSLTYLAVSYCQLTGSLPNSLINLRHLTTLYLSANMLSGTLPSFLFTLPLLQNVRLSGNMFSGGLPSELFNCRSLKELFLSYNQFDGEIYEGSTPPSHIRLINLVSLDLSHNNFSGSCELDTLLSSLPNLIQLSLSYSGVSVVTNNATDYINTNVSYLGLACCKLTVFPESLRAMKNLESLDLSNNDIHGHVPDWAGKIGGNRLYYLNISHNTISGLPQFQWDGLTSLYLQSNQIQGPFPSSICNMRNLQYLDMANNSFGGVIPKCIENMSTFRMIDLRTNHFHGTIPNVCKDYGQLEGLLLNGNELEGEVPTSLSKCSFFKILDVGNNCLNGTFPGWLGDLPNLQVLILRSNNLHGPVKTTFTIEFPFPLLRVLYLSNNKFVGHLPQKYFQNFSAMKDVLRTGSKPKYLNIGGFYTIYPNIIVVVKGHELSFTKISIHYTIVDLSNNKFEGEIPNVIGNCNSLIVLNLSHNNLNGQIPHALGNLSEIESLDLSSNKLIGEIPQSLVDLRFLSILNLSQNRLVGRIPEGNQFNTFKANSYKGNLKLCGFPLPKHCEPKSSPQLVEADEDEDESGFTWKAVTLGYGCGTLLGLVMGYLMLSTGRPKWFIAIVDAGERMIKTRQNKRRYIYIGK